MATVIDPPPISPDEHPSVRPDRRPLDRDLIDPVPRDHQDARPAGPTVFPQRGFLPALEKCRCPKLARFAAKLIIAGLVVTTALLALAPWQQTVKGTGNVTNFDPKLRPQVLESPIDGRVIRLGDGIREMSLVEKGDLIVELADQDPDRLERLRLQRDSRLQERRSAEDALRAAENELTNLQEKLPILETRLETLRRAQTQTLAVADQYIEVERNKRDAAARRIDDLTAQVAQTKADNERYRQMYREKLGSGRDYQIAKQKYESAEANLRKAEAELAAAEESIAAKQRERDTKLETTQAEIELFTGQLRDAQASIEAARSRVAASQQKVQQATVAVTSLESDVRRQENQKVVAPIDGYLVKIYADAGASVVKQGEPLARIVPVSEDRVVQIWLDGNDASLVEPGRHVRLQFEGWPAIQFAGWPSVAVGTFGGEVISVDATDDGTGQFRMLVREVSGTDPETGLVEEPWPQGRWLRPGVLAKAWVLLDTVPLWWEVWRNLNGFPPVVDTDGEPKESSDKDKPKRPKLPKL